MAIKATRRLIWFPVAPDVRPRRGVFQWRGELRRLPSRGEKRLDELLGRPVDIRFPVCLGTLLRPSPRLKIPQLLRIESVIRCPDRKRPAQGSRLDRRPGTDRRFQNGAVRFLMWTEDQMRIGRPADAPRPAPHVCDTLTALVSLRGMMNQDERRPELFGIGVDGVVDPAHRRIVILIRARWEHPIHPAGCGRRLRAWPSRACRSSSFRRSCGRADPAPSGCHTRSPAGAWRTSAATYGR